MPPINGPYQSRFFNFVNRHSLRFRNRLEETLRHWRTVAGLGVQALIYPLYWFFHPQRWTGPLLTPGYSEPQLPLQESSPPWTDQPLRQVLDQIQPWFTEPAGGVALKPIPLSFTPTAPSQLQPAQPLILRGQFFENLQQQLAQGQLPHEEENTVRTTLTPWPQRLKNLVLPCPYPDLIIRGIASRCSDRRLVLTTQDNEILDVLSSEQCQVLNKTIQGALASFNQQQRLRWAWQQQSWGGITLVKAETQELILPLQWLWQGLYWWEQGETKEQMRQTFTPLPPLPAGLVHLPKTLPRLASHFATQLQQTWPLALAKVGQNISSLKTGSALHPQGPDLSQLQALLEAAIAYFFGGVPSEPPLPPGMPSLPAPESSSPWLSWQDVGGESAVPLGLGFSVSGAQAETIVPSTSSLKALSPDPLPPRTTPEREPDWDWIDTNYQPVGYHKHPLEIILEALDHLVLILEEGLRWLWLWTSRLLSLIPKKLS